MTERILVVDDLDAIAESVAMSIEAPVKAEKKPVRLCVSVQDEWFPVSLPGDADLEYLKQVTGSRGISELKYDREGNVYEPAEKLQENHVYELFCPDKTRFQYFLNEFRIIH